MTGRQQNVFYMYAIQRKSYKEIAATLNTTYQAVYMMVKRLKAEYPDLFKLEQRRTQTVKT